MSKSKLNSSERELAISRLKCALVLLYTLYGVPCIYYGDEIATEGEKDPFNRRCYNWEGGDKNLSNFYKKLGEIRKDNLFKDSLVEILHEKDGLIVFKRSCLDYEIYVATNVSESVYNVKFNKKVKELLSGEIKNAFTLKKYEYAVVKTDLNNNLQ